VNCTKLHCSSGGQMVENRETVPADRRIFVRRVNRVGIVRLGFICFALAMCAAAGRGQEWTKELTAARAATAPVAATAPTVDSSSADRNAQLPDAPAARAAQDDLDVSWKTLPKRLARDQKDIWLFPLQLAKGRYLIPTLAVVGGTAGLIAADPHATPYFRTHAANWDDFNDAFDGSITAGEIAIVPATFLLVGGARHDPYATKTGLLASEAYADSEIVDLALKAITHRQRPSDVAAGAPFNDTFFNRGNSVFDSSFPSGHAVGAFSVATIVARRYGHHRWVPFVAYGCAAAISLSRVTNRAHFPSDVFVGAALGYTIARFEVLRH
jgi:membrane-associated phospholipid phosphatase